MKSAFAGSTAAARRPAHLEPRIHDVAQLVGHQVDRDDRQQERHARIEADPVFAGQHVLEAVGDQQPDRRLGDRQPQTEERERRLELDRVGDLDRCHNDQRWHAVGQQVAQHDAGARQRDTCAASMYSFCRSTSARADRARVVRPLDRDQRDDDLVDALTPSIASTHQGDQDRGKGSWMSARRMIPASTKRAEVRRRQSQRETDRQRQHRARDAHEERDADAVEDRRQHVAALVVGAEPVGLAGGSRALSGRELGIEHVELREVVGVLRRDERRRQRERADEHEERQPHDREATLEELGAKRRHGASAAASARPCAAVGGRRRPWLVRGAAPSRTRG